MTCWNHYKKPAAPNICYTTTSGMSCVQAGPYVECTYSILHIHTSDSWIRTTVESGCSPPRRSLQNNLVEKSPFHPQLLWFQKYGKDYQTAVQPLYF